MAIISSALDFVNGDTKPSAPGSGSLALYPRSGVWYSEDSSGVETAIAGGVSIVSVVTANGLAGTVATATTTPAITLSTTITGILQGNGTAISAASTTGSGSVVLATSPTLVTPVIGAASGTSLSLTSQLTSTLATGTAPFIVASTTRVANLNVASAGNADTVTTNANLTGPITSVGNATSVASQTGTGSTFVMNTSPTLVTPNLGTPTTLVGTNITGTAAGLTAGTVTTNANLTGPVTSTGNATAVTNNAITNAMLAQMAAHTYKGNNTGSTANSIDVTSTQLTADLNAATTSLQGMMSAADKSKSNNWYNSAFYNVLDNGISPSNSGATNVTAWNALMTLLANTTATVYFPPGVYDIASVCNIPAGVHIRVMGAGTTTRTSEAFGTIIRTTSGTADMFTCGDWYEQFTDLTFRSSVTRTAGAVINSGNNVGIEAINCNFNAQFNGIVFTGGTSAGNIALVKNCHFTDTVNFGIQVDGANSNLVITECTADCTSPAVAHLEVNQCGSLLISDCDFIRATNNMRLNPDSGTKGVFSVYCSNVFFDTASGSSVKYQGAGSTNIQRSKYVNCWFSGSVNVVEFASTATTLPTAIDFVNCDIYSNSANGILATAVQDFSMDNCRVAGNATAGINTVASASSVTKFNIQNCTIGPTAGIGANAIGINIQAGTYGSYNITGNAVSGNTSSNNITDAGSVATTDLKKIGDNLGHLIKGAISTNNGGVTSGTGETLLMNARIPANAVTVGQVFRVKLFGNSSSTGTLAVKVKVGANGTIADTAIWTPATSVGQVANHRSSIECLIFVKTIGGAGTAFGDGVARFSNLFVEEAAIAAPATQTIVTTAPWFIDVTCACSVGTFTVTEGVIEAL